MTTHLLAILSTLLAFGPSAPAQDFAWHLGPEIARDSTAPQRLSPVAFAPSDVGAGLIFNTTDDTLTVDARPSDLPTGPLTVSAWVAIERGNRWGGLVGCVEDNGEEETGFVLGFNDDVFNFGLSTTGADDGNGKLTYLAGATPFVPGRWHHVAATFDGVNTSLYVDGKLDASTTAQSGRLLYDAKAALVVGAYRDVNEHHPLDGRMLHAQIVGRALDATAIQAAFNTNAALTELPPWTDMTFDFLVSPYLTWPTTDAVSVMFETNFPSTARVEYRRDDEAEDDARATELTTTAAFHECRLTDLRAHQKYFYRVTVDGVDDDAVSSPWLSFRTAATPDDAFTFVVIGDTQTNGEVAKRVSDLAWMHRPNLAVHAGDLVDAGTSNHDWTGTFFPSMQPLIGRVPLMPVLGNHEQDAAHYYNYMSLPEPERWYSFRYGNAEFFMMDGNRSLDDQSAQLAWLADALESSTAVWRFAVLHQPPYTSDSNDYGDTFATTSTRGDVNVRNIIDLLEQHDVDICFSGHVHDYERTFPIREEQVTAYADGGVIYVTAAGGGGSLEDFDPANTWFGHKKARYHHLVYLAIHGTQLEFQAIDENGRLFDSFTLEKR